MGASVETYFTLEELAKYLCYSEKTIRKWVLNKEIPYHKIHNSIRFRLSEIEKWIDTNGAYTTTEQSENNEGNLFPADDEINNTSDSHHEETTQTGVTA
jgi:excisionase family DNA binding protein